MHSAPSPRNAALEESPLTTPTVRRKQRFRLGLTLWLVTLASIDKKRGLEMKDALTVDMCALYWHFVDVVWIAIFVLLYLIK